MHPCYGSMCFFNFLVPNDENQIFSSSAALTLGNSFHPNISNICENLFFDYLVNPLNISFTKWSNTLKQFVGNAGELFECV